jgi:hypothetical protein
MSLNKKNLTNSLKNMASKTITGAKNAVNKIKTEVKPNKNGFNAIKNKLNPIKNSLESVKNVAKEKIANVSKKINGIGENKTQPQITKLGQMSLEFLNANTAISKFVSFILYLLLFVILFQIGTGLLQRFMGPQYNPYIIKGMVASDKITTRSTNPNVKRAKPIYRSVDENQGLEFTWNVWFFINSEVTNNLFSGAVAPKTPEYGYRIFSKGPFPTRRRLSTNIGNSLNVCPGAYLKNTGNDIQLNIVINTFIDKTNSPTTILENITINGIPNQNWVCCTIRVQNKAVDVYINGMLKIRKNLQNLPKQNNYDTYIGDANGFKGYVSSLRYYAYAISYDEIQSLAASGPSLKVISDSSFPTSSDYLSMKWYFT